MFNFFGKKKKKNDPEVLSKLNLLKCQLDLSNLKLKKDLHQLTNYFNKIPIMYAIIDYSGHIIRFNDSLISAISCINKDCIGSSLCDFIHPDDINIFNNFKKSLVNNKSGETIFRTLSKNGSVTCIKWGGVNVEEDQLIILFGQDITNEIELSDKLKSIIKYKDLIINGYPSSIITTDLNGRIKEFNRVAEKESGYEKSMIVGEHIFEIFPDIHLFDENRLDKINKTLIKKRSGDLVECYILLLPLFDDKKIVGYFGIWGEDYLNYVKSFIYNYENELNNTNS